jgi:hypothetical protein
MKTQILIEIHKQSRHAKTHTVSAYYDGIY